MPQKSLNHRISDLIIDSNYIVDCTYLGIPPPWSLMRTLMSFSPLEMRTSMSGRSSDERFRVSTMARIEFCKESD